MVLFCQSPSLHKARAKEAKPLHAILWMDDKDTSLGNLMI
jgi:hypothetical protein